jgi:AcrR family transcriptional regulator
MYGDDMPRPLSDEKIEAFREELCEAATRRFAEAGYAGVTLRGLAGELGVSPMTPYRYFRNKEEIFDAVRDAAFDRFGHHVRRTFEQSRALPPRDQMRAMGRGYVRFALEEPHAYRIMFELEKPERPVGDENVEHCWKPLLEATGRFVREAAPGRGDPLLLAHLCWVTLHGLVTLHLSDKLRMGLGLEQLVDPLIETVLGDAAPSSPGPRPAPPPPASREGDA